MLALNFDSYLEVQNLIKLLSYIYSKVIEICMNWSFQWVAKEIKDLAYFTYIYLLR